MARLDAAARFTPTLTVVMNGAVREHATAALTHKVLSVSDRKAAEVRARSEFSMVPGQPIQSIFCLLMALHTKATATFRRSENRNRLHRPHFVERRSVSLFQAGVFDH